MFFFKNNAIKTFIIAITFVNRTSLALLCGQYLSSSHFLWHVHLETLTCTNSVGVPRSPGAQELVYCTWLVPSGHQASAPLSLPVLLLLITAAPVLPWGKLTSLFSTALLVVWLRNYLCFNSLLCNKGRKESIATHNTSMSSFCYKGGFMKMYVVAMLNGSSSITICLSLYKEKKIMFSSLCHNCLLFFFLLLPTLQAIFSFIAKVDIWCIKWLGKKKIREIGMCKCAGFQREVTTEYAVQRPARNLSVATRSMGRGIMVAIKALGHKDKIITGSRR